MSEEINVLLKIGSKFYEGKVHLQTVGQSPPKATNPEKPIFPEPYSEMLTISDQGDCWQIKPKAFLEAGDFSEILRLVKTYNGTYVSAGKSSHFRVPK